MMPSHSSRRVLFGLLSGVICLTLGQCRPDSTQTTESSSITWQRLSYQQAMMGTRFSITVYTDDHQKADSAANAAFQLADDVNDACSDYDVTSELMRLNAAPAHQAIPLSPLLFDVLSRALDIAKQTGGAYDPTLGHHSYNWRMARKKERLPSAETIRQAHAASGWQHLELDHNQRSVTKKVKNMRLDLGGIAKGYAAEIMLRYLKQQGLSHASITAGGEVRLGDAPPDKKGWQITLKTLDEQHQFSPKTITLSNCAISTSGDLHQSITIGGQRYSHICDPTTGLGLTQRISATVVGKNATETDALATALCVQPTLKPTTAEYMIVIGKSPKGFQRITSSDWNRSISQ